MKSAFLLLLATALFAAGLWVFARSSDHFAAKDYLAGILQVVAGLALVRAGVDLSRLSVFGRPRGTP